MALAVSRDPRGLREIHDAVGFGYEGGFELACSPLEGAGAALGAKGLTELLGLGADVGDGLVNGAAIRTQKKTPPKELCALGGVVRVGDYARTGCEMSRHSWPAKVIPCPRVPHCAFPDRRSPYPLPLD